MRVGFAGTPAFAAASLAAILDAGFDVPLVLTRPDRPRGRGLAVQPSPVKALAAERGIPVLQPPTLKTPEARAAALAVPLDVLVVAAYGLILPPALLAWPRHGCVNVHASLLPRWRGAAPVERAILAGDAETGISIMRMDEGLDTGPVIDRVRVPIAADETSGTLTSKLAAAGAAAIVAALARLRDAGALPATPQQESGATYAPKIDRREAAIDWTRDAGAIARQIRAFDPAPGVSATLGGVALKVWRGTAEGAAPGARPGTVLAAGATGIVVACGEGALRIALLQPAGGRRMDARAFLAGRALAPGAAFDAAPAR
jgi:methionyl-tRNA formyltransferase